MTTRSTVIETKRKNRGIFDPSLIEHRKKVSRIEAMGKPSTNVIYTDQQFHFDDTHSTFCRVYRPKDLNLEKYPTIFFIPGTAYVANEIDYTHIICSHLAEHSKCQVIMINHRLAPENPAPTAVEDSFNEYCFFTRVTNDVYRVDNSRIIIAGYSSGANIAILMAIRAIKQQRPQQQPIARLILLSPLVDLSRSLSILDGDRYADFEAQDYNIKPEFVRWFLGLYIPPHMRRTDPAISPFFEKDEWLSQLPATDIIYAEFDRFRSDAERFAEKLSSLGVQVYKKMLKDEDHTFLWHQFEIVEQIGNRLANTLYNKLGHDQKLFIVKPTLPNGSKPDLDEKNEFDASSRQLTSKL